MTFEEAKSSGRSFTLPGWTAWFMVRDDKVVIEAYIGMDQFIGSEALLWPEERDRKDWKVKV